MKRKRSAAFVMMVVLVLTATAVLATSLFTNCFGGSDDLKNTYTATSATQEILPSATLEPLPTAGPSTELAPAQWHEYDANPGAIIYNSFHLFTETGFAPSVDYTQYTANAEFVYSNKYNNGNEPVWIVTFSLDDVPVYKAMFNYSGQFMDAISADKEFANTDSKGSKLRDDMSYTLYNAEGAYFYDWTLEEKAIFSRRWVPTAELYKARHPYFTGEDNLVWAWTRRVYGSPSDAVITQEEALGIAEEAARQLDTSGALIQSPVSIYYFYDITDEQQPLWLVVLSWKTSSDADDEILANHYFITVDATTGTVLDAYEDHSKDSINAFLGNPYYAAQTENTEADSAEISETILTDRIPAELHDYDATEEEALAAAQSVLTDEIGLSADEAEQYTAEAEFFYSVWYNFGEEPVWHVTFSQNGVPVYKVLLDYTAAYIDWALTHHEFSQPYRLEESGGGELGDYSELINAEGIDFFNWTLEEKAAFSEKWRPIADTYKAEHPYFTGVRNNFWLWTRRIFGLPSDTDIQQDEALDIAKEHLKLYGETDETLAQIDNVQYFFDVTEADQPQWRMCIEWNADFVNHNVERERQYMLKIDAVTGEVMDTIFCPQGIDSGAVLSEFISEP